jgi:transposase
MFLGIDVAKDTFEAALIKDQVRQTQGPRGDTSKPLHKGFANTAAGHRQLLSWLQQQGATKVHACLEATGTYAQAPALCLREAGHIVSLVNPAQISAFGRSQLMRTKTDKADAQLIARFCQMQRPPSWSPPSTEVRQLQALVRRLEALVEMRTVEHNRLNSGLMDGPARDLLSEHVDFLDQQITRARRLIEEHIGQYPLLKRQRDLLVSIPGIAQTTAAAILAELLPAPRFDNAGQVAAFAGLVPRIRQSGTSVRGRPCLTKVGSPRLRRALYFPAVAALRFNPRIRALGERLAGRGKNKMLIIVAAMRKLIHLVYGVLKSGKPFDPDFIPDPCKPGETLITLTA